MRPRISVQVIGVGRNKESYAASGSDHYKRLLGKYCTVDSVWIKPDAAQSKEKEGKRILEKIEKKRLAIALDEKGKAMDSKTLSATLEKWLAVKKAFSFIIGGHHGLSNEVLERADHTIALSIQTYSHQLIRVMLLEQLYRCFTIVDGHPYHRA